MINTLTAEIEVLVTRVVSPLDTGAIHGRGRGVLLDDRGIEVTFLLGQVDFQNLRQQMLCGDGEVSFTVGLGDVTAIGAVRGEAAGERIARSRHRLYGLVKAVTYHQLAVEQRDGGWSARVILDV